MRWAPETSPLARLLVWPIALLALAGGLLARWAPALVLELSHCPLRRLTGLPCPTCGGTHAAVALARGDWSGALRANPLVALGAAVLGAWLGWSLAAAVRPGLRRRPVLGPGEKRAAGILAALAVVLTWAWEIGLARR